MQQKAADQAIRGLLLQIGTRSAVGLGLFGILRTIGTRLDGLSVTLNGWRRGLLMPAGGRQNRTLLHRLRDV